MESNDIYAVLGFLATLILLVVIYYKFKAVFKQK